MERLLKLANFLRLIDSDGRLSLTNLAVVITLIKLALTSNAIAPTDLGGIIAALGSYQAKRLIETNKAS